jgi:hypothetical protein
MTGWLKLAPVRTGYTILEMSNAVVPVLVTSAVTSWPTATVPKARLYGIKLASGWITVV